MLSGHKPDDFHRELYMDVHLYRYLNYLEEIKYRKTSTLTLQQVKEPILSFEEFNEMMERESAMPVEAVGNVQDTVVVEEAEEIEERNNWN